MSVIVKSEIFGIFKRTFSLEDKRYVGESKNEY